MLHDGEALPQIIPLARDLREQGVIELVEHHTGPRAGDRVSAKGGAVHPGRHPCAHRFPGKAQADGQSVADALRTGKNIRAHAVVLPRVQLARAAHARLYLVKDQQQAARVTQLPHPADIFRLHRHHAALALDGLEHDGAHCIVDSVLKRLNIPRRDVFEPRIVRGKALWVQRLLPGGGQCDHTAPVEGVDQRNHGGMACPTMVIGVFARRLDRALVGLRAGIAQKDALKSRAPCDFFRKRRRGRRVVQV